MKRFAPTILSLILTTVVSSTAFAGHIAVGRATGHIPVGRAAGHIAVGRASGNIPVGRTASIHTTSMIRPQLSDETSRLDIEAILSGTFAGLIRMLLENGALF
jgi:hypothetical protein